MSKGSKPQIAKIGNKKPPLKQEPEKDKLTNYGQIDHWGRDDNTLNQVDEDNDFIDHCFVDGEDDN